MNENIALSTLSSIYNNSFTQYLTCSRTIGSFVSKQSLCVDNVFKTTLDLVEKFGKYRKPSDPLAEQYLTEPLFREIDQVKSFETRSTEHIFQVTLISKSVKIFEWVKEQDAEKFVNNLLKYVQFYQQKVHNEIETGTIHYDWLKCWNETYEELSMFIVNFFKSGIVWMGKSVFLSSNVLGDSPHFASNNSSVCSVSTSLTKEDKKWSIQNQKNSHKDLVLSVARKEDTVSIFSCEDCTVIIESAVDTITLTLCSKVTILFRNAVKLEASDCTACNFHCFEIVCQLDLISCNNCGIYLSEKSQDASILTTTSTGIHVNFPFSDGLYQCFKIGEQLKTRIVPGRGVETTVVIKKQ